MANSDYETSDAPKKADAEDNKEAQQAAAGLKRQIAAIRDQVRQASADIRGAMRRSEPRSFGKKD